MQVRQSKPADAEAVADVLRRSIVELCHQDHRGRPDVLERWLANKTPETASAWITAADSFCVSAVADGGEVCGFGLLAAAGEILLLYVSPEHVGRGVGRDLLRALEERAVDRGLGEIRLDSSLTARGFYARHGYIDAESCGDRTDGLFCNAMRKTL